jgi:hypothetical protein
VEIDKPSATYSTVKWHYSYADTTPGMMRFSSSPILSKNRSLTMSQCSYDLSEQYQFPLSLALSDLRPDIVAYSILTKSNKSMKQIYETNFRDARARKEEKYTEFVEVEENGFMVDLITVEVGSRVFVNYESFSRLNSTLVP